MDIIEWFKYADDTKDRVKILIASYHPANDSRGTKLPITAHNAERASIGARREIRNTFEGFPTEQYQFALNRKDFNEALAILNQTWLGVPESTLCWNLIGFSELVKLCEDIPDDEN